MVSLGVSLDYQASHITGCLVVSRQIERDFAPKGGIYRPWADNCDLTATFLAHHFCKCLQASFRRRVG